MFDGGAVRATGVLAEVGDLVSCIGDVALHDLLEKVDIFDNVAVVKPMVKCRRLNISSENHA